MLMFSKVRGAVITTLGAVQLEDLHVVVKFILHSISASDAYEVRALESTTVFVWFFSLGRGGGNKT